MLFVKEKTRQNREQDKFSFEAKKKSEIAFQVLLFKIQYNDIF